MRQRWQGPEDSRRASRPGETVVARSAREAGMAKRGNNP